MVIIMLGISIRSSHIVVLFLFVIVELRIVVCVRLCMFMCFLCVCVHCQVFLLRCFPVPSYMSFYFHMCCVLFVSICSVPPVGYSIVFLQIPLLSRVTIFLCLLLIVVRIILFLITCVYVRCCSYVSVSRVLLLVRLLSCVGCCLLSVFMCFCFIIMLCFVRYV